MAKEHRRNQKVQWGSGPDQEEARVNNRGSGPFLRVHEQTDAEKTWRCHETQLLPGRSQSLPLAVASYREELLGSLLRTSLIFWSMDWQATHKQGYLLPILSLKKLAQDRCGRHGLGSLIGHVGFNTTCASSSSESKREGHNGVLLLCHSLKPMWFWWISNMRVKGCNACHLSVQLCKGPEWQWRFRLQARGSRTPKPCVPS